MKRQGFTLIELMIVVAIIGLMSTMAVPTYQSFTIRSQVKEALSLADPIQQTLTRYYQAQKTFPGSNEAAGLSAPEHLIGNFVSGIKISEGGAIHVTLGHRINAQVRGKIITLRPAVVAAAPENPISWLCGRAEAVPGMNAQGENYTAVPAMYLPFQCRSWQEPATKQ